MVREGANRHHRIAWEDRFNRPSERQLREALKAPSAQLFDAARDELTELCGERVSVDWQGSCWKWTLGFGSKRNLPPVAVLIPNPEDFQIAMRVDDAFVQEVWPRRLKRAVRDGLGLAAAPFDTEWSVWTITSKPMLKEVLGLVRENLAFRRSSVA